MNYKTNNQKNIWFLFIFSIILTLFCQPAQLIAQNNASAKISVTFSNISLKDAMQKVESVSKYTFFYDAKKTDVSQLVSLNATNQPLETAVEEMLSSTDLGFEIENKQIVLYPKSAKPASKQIRKNISGRILDEKNEPVMGASILIKGSTHGAVSDANGNFSLDVNPGNVLSVSYLGYRNLEIAYNGQNSMNITLKEDTQLLDEVVVTALGIKKSEKGLGYATQNVNMSEMTVVKTVDVSTGLTGKIAGLNVWNSTEFNQAPSLSLRGETPLLVVDGVPYFNLSLRDIAADDIESISVLKGATASALYGERGKSGAVMVTTKRGLKEQGLQIEVNSSAMFDNGFLAMPEVQTSYSSGGGGKYAISDYVWGDKLDIGRTAKQYNPYTYTWEEMPLVSKGKNNLQNFMQTSMVLNNNVNIAQQGEHGGFRTSLTYVYNEGQYPNTVLNKYTATVSGNIKYGNFDMEAGMTYNKRSYPNSLGGGYGGSGFLYNLVVWQGTEFDIRDYQNYWVAGKEQYQQNWMDTKWYNNPWYIAHEMRNSGDYDLTNGFAKLNYKILPWLNATVRTGIDSYSNKNEYIRPISTVGDLKGSYSRFQSRGFSANSDALLMFDKKFGKSDQFGVDGFLGGTIFYEQYDGDQISTKNGLTVPGFYSIYASVDPPGISQYGNKKQVNSLYGKATLSWKSILFLDVTGRNDWSSTLSKETRSYFYPSLAGSYVISEMFSLPKAISLLKLRGSWAVAKEAPGIYAINSTYGISINEWDGYNGASYPTIMHSSTLRPQSSRSYEFGLASNFFLNRLKFDIAYYDKLYYDRLTNAAISNASGFLSTQVNFKEDIVRRGVEITLGGTPVKTKDWQWDAAINWSTSKLYYASIDPNYSQDYPWVKKGARLDWVSVYDWDKSPDGQLIHRGGKPVASNYSSLLGHSSPNYIWGFSNEVKWKQFSVGVSFDGRVGGLLFNTTNQAMWNSGSHIESDNQYRYDQVVNGNKNYVGKGVIVKEGSVERDKYGNITKDTRVFVPNDVPVSYESYVISMNPYIGTQRSQNFFESTFIKLRELSLTYNMPKPICEKIRMKNLSVSFIGQNLWMWTKEFKYSDPDWGAENMNAPSVRYLGGNIKFNF